MKDVSLNLIFSAYTYTYTNNVNAGTATLTVKGTGDYKGTASVTYTIQSADASKLVGAIATQEYRGYSLAIPAGKIDLTLDGKKIDVASNFTLTYGENKEVGEGTVTLTPKNNNFTVIPLDVLVRFPPNLPLATARTTAY